LARRCAAWSPVCRRSRHATSHRCWGQRSTQLHRHRHVHSTLNTTPITTFTPEYTCLRPHTTRGHDINTRPTAHLFPPTRTYHNSSANGLRIPFPTDVPVTCATALTCVNSRSMQSRRCTPTTMVESIDPCRRRHRPALGRIVHSHTEHLVIHTHGYDEMVNIISRGQPCQQHKHEHTLMKSNTRSDNTCFCLIHICVKPSHDSRTIASTTGVCACAHCTGRNKGPHRPFSSSTSRRLTTPAS